VGDSTPSVSSLGTSGLLPVFQAREVAPPDLPATSSGVPAAYFAYPKAPVQLSKTPPANGGTVSAFRYLAAAAPPSVSANEFWQELNTRLGTDLRITFTPNADYATKAATTIASGDIPDLMPLAPADVSRIDQVLGAKFQDLSPWLSGESIKQFPNLAALPTVSWKNMVYNGGIYGIPYSVPVGQSLPLVRADIVEKLGIDSSDIADGDAFVKFCRALTGADGKRWAIGEFPTVQSVAQVMAGAPNEWRVEASAFTSAYQADEYKDAIDISRTIWKSGVCFSDAPSAPRNQARSMFIAGTTSIMFDGYGSWAVWTAEGREQTPGFRIGGLVLPKWHGGGQGLYHQGPGIGAKFTAIRKASNDRVMELLRILDWIASPFGSAEYLFVTYGLADRDYKLVGSDPVATPTGTQEVQSMTITSLARSYIPIYVAGDPETTKSEHECLSRLLEVSAPLPTVGLISETALSKGPSIEKAISQLEIDVILGRKTMADWDAGVKSWAANGGRAIAQELEASGSHAEPN
jgi:putative aldouronate transport system substrate-binding protein